MIGHLVLFTEENSDSSGNILGYRLMSMRYLYKSAVMLDGEKPNTFNVEQGVAQGGNLSPILFSEFS